MAVFNSFSGTVTQINDFLISSGDNSGCYKLVSLENKDGSMVNFVVSPTTYFVDHVMLILGDNVTGFYDANTPVPLIYPPQYRGIVMTLNTSNQNVKVDYFNSQLLSQDGSLKLNLAPSTHKVLENGQAFSKTVANRNLIVIYGATTRSIPAQTTPYQIIVLCRNL